MLSLACYLALYDRANPEASIDLSVGRDDALELAKAFLHSEGWNVDDYRSAVTFNARDSAKRYLEKELPIEEANRLMRGEVAVWGWYCRWYRFEEQEDFWVELSPSGRLIGFWHDIEEAAPGENLSAEDARAKAEAFLESRLGISLTGYTLLRQNQEERPNRIDHSFEWERNGFKAGDAVYRLVVQVCGGAVGSYHEFLKIPEGWRREQDAQASRRGVLMGAAQIGYCLLCVAAGVVLLLELRVRRLRARFGLAVVAVLAAVHLAEWANWWPLRWIGYDPSDTFGAFVGDEVLYALVDALGLVLAVLAFALPGEAIARRVFPGKAPLSKVLRGSFWRSREVFLASIVGCSMAMLHSAYVTLFYMGAKTVGAWSPQGWPYWDILATPLPWLHPLTVGLSAAINEELTFRLFAIAFFWKVTKRRWAAVLIPAVIWAFLHSNYPQEPIYVRGIELTVVGIAYGLVFLRYGFFASFISHFAFNALATSQVLLRSGEPCLQFSGAAAVALMFLAIVPGLVSILRRTPLATNDDVWADGEHVVRYPLGHAADIRDTPRTFEPYQPLSRRRWAMLCALTAVSLVVLALTPPSEKEPFASVEVDRRQARAIADSFLAGKAVDPTSFRSVTTFNNELNGEEFDYLYRHVEKERFDAVCRQRFAGRAGWLVRYFRPHEKEEYEVWIEPGGAIHSFTHLLPEDAPGARLTRGEALQLAEEFLCRKGLLLEDYRLVGEHAYERTARNDYSFEWEDVTETLDEAAWRVRVRIQGYEADGFWTFLEVPESWVLEHDRRELWDIVKAGTGISLILLGFAILVWLFVHHFLHHAFEWRAVLPFAVFCVACILVQRINAWPTLWSAYRTSTAPGLFLAWNLLVHGILMPIGVFFGSAAVFGLAEALFRRAFPRAHPISHWFGKPWIVESGESSSETIRLPLRRAWGESLLTGFMALAVVSAAGVLEVPLDEAQPLLQDIIRPLMDFGFEPASAIDASTPSLFVHGGNDSYWPCVDLACQAAVITGVAAASLLAAAGLYRRLLKRDAWALLALVAIVSAALAAQRSTTWHEFTAHGLVLLAQGIISAGALWAVAHWFLRGNLPAYAFVVLFGILYGYAFDLSNAGNAFERMNGFALFGLMIALLVLGMVLLFTGKRRA